MGRYLDFGGNGLTGTLPSSLSALTKLQYLSGTQAAEEWGFGKPCNLLCITTVVRGVCRCPVGTGGGGFNQVSGTLPSVLSLLQALTVFNMNNNNLSGSVLETLCVLSKLRVLWITQNPAVIGTIPTAIGLQTTLV